MTKWRGTQRYRGNNLFEPRPRHVVEFLYVVRNGLNLSISYYDRVIEWYPTSSHRSEPGYVEHGGAWNLSNRLGRIHCQEPGKLKLTTNLGII